MGAYHQMGYASENLLGEPGLSAFRGAILSPVDYDESQIHAQVSRYQSSSFECIFDPQLYYPNTYRERLQQWSYFPSGMDTADANSDAWWSSISRELVAAATRVGVTAACSPAVIPRRSSLDYLRRMLDVGEEFGKVATRGGLTPILTAVLSMDMLAEGDASWEAASIIAQSSADRVLLVFTSETEPRRELSDAEQLIGGLRVVHELARSGIEVMVGFTSTDAVLYKAVGATHCATGKFFNLRRFASSRFEEPSQGGRQLPYFTEERLMAFLREADVLRLLRADFAFSAASTNRNPYTQEIFDIVRNGSGAAWVALAWKQYMAWFADAEARVSNPEDADALLAEAESGWLAISHTRPRVLMTEPTNDGAWNRQWRIALSEFLS